MPTVSVIIPIYNGAEQIGHALRSVFSQSYRDFEVVVVDDGSTDELDRALSEWADRIVFRRQPNAGPASARNAALRLARGRLVAFLDADDEWLPEKLARQVAYFERFPQAGMLHTAVVGEPLPRAYEGEDALGEAPRNVFCPLFHTEFFIRTLTVMAPCSVLHEAGGFDERREIHVEDWDLWLRIAARWPVGFLPQRLALHRRGGHMSTAFEKTHRGQALVIQKNRHLCMVACATHRLNSERCLNERTFVLYSSLGYERFRHGDRLGARRAWSRALALRPWRIGTYTRYLASFLPERWLARLRTRERRALADARGNAGPKRTFGPERLTIVNDTTYRRTRRRIAQAAHRVDAAIVSSRRPRKQILFEAASPMSFGLFQPVYRRLLQDPRLEFSFTARGRAWKPQAIFAAVGITERVIEARRAKWSKWDLAINTDFWEMTELRRRTQRVHLFHGVAGKYGLDAPVGLAREIATFACLMFPNRDRLERYIEAGLIDGDDPGAALVGYPKADVLVDGSLDRNAIFAGLGLDSARATVIYAPTWSPHSSLNAIGEEIIEGLAGAGYQVIVKLHDRSYDRDTRGSGGIDWAARLERYRHHPLVRVRQDADATPLLFVCDALVTDHSSIGFEYMLLDRPIVVVDCPELLQHSRISPDKIRRLRAATDVVTSADEVREAVAHGLAHPRRHSPARRATAEELFYRAGTATDRAVAIVYELLDLVTPVASGAHASPAVLEAVS